MTNLIQRYIDTPKAGRLVPQPNEGLSMTKLVKRLLRLK